MKFDSGSVKMLLSMSDDGLSRAAVMIGSVFGIKFTREIDAGAVRRVLEALSEADLERIAEISEIAAAKGEK